MPAFADELLLAVLRKVEFLEVLDDPGLRDFAAIADEKFVLSGAVLFEERAPAESMFIVRTGRIEIVKGHGTSDRKVLATTGDGGVLGEMGLVENEPRSASAIAATTSRLLVVTREPFLAFLSSHPGADIRMRSLLVKRHTTNIGRMFGA